MTKAWRYPYPLPAAALADHVHESAFGSVRGATDQKPAHNVETRLRFHNVIAMDGMTWDAEDNAWVVSADGAYLPAAACKWGMAPAPPGWALPFWGAVTLHIYRSSGGVVTLLDDPHVYLYAERAFPEVVTTTAGKPVPLLAGDRVYCTVLQAVVDNGSLQIQMDVLAEDENSPWFTLHRVGPTPAAPVSPTELVIDNDAFGTLRNNFSGYVGCRFVPAQNMTVTHLGRWKHAGNTGVHSVGLAPASGSFLREVFPDLTSASVDAYTFVALASPLALTAGTTYYLVTTVTSGDGQNWSDTKRAAIWDVGTIADAFYSGGWTVGAAGQMFGPVSLKYTIP